MNAAERLSETIGYCEGLCGGLHSHHLVNGLCPTCQNNIHIQTTECRLTKLNVDDTDQYSINELGMDASVYVPEISGC